MRDVWVMRPTPSWKDECCYTKNIFRNALNCSDLPHEKWCLSHTLEDALSIQPLSNGSLRPHFQTDLIGHWCRTLQFVEASKWMSVPCALLFLWFSFATGQNIRRSHAMLFTITPHPCTRDFTLALQDSFWYSGTTLFLTFSASAFAPTMLPHTLMSSAFFLNVRMRLRSFVFLYLDFVTFKMSYMFIHIVP